VFTPFHKPPYPYLYGRSIDETTTVGITSWYRYVLDTLVGDNFLGTHALEACTLIESLVGVPPIHVVKTKITLEEVIEKVGTLKKIAKYP
jgi:hypothetical protein